MRRDWNNFKPAGSKYILKRLAFPVLREGNKLRLLANNGRAQYRKGEDASEA